MTICLIRLHAALHGKQVPLTIIPSSSQNERYFGKILLKVKLQFFVFPIPQAQILQSIDNVLQFGAVWMNIHQTEFKKFEW